MEQRESHFWVKLSLPLPSSLLRYLGEKPPAFRKSQGVECRRPFSLSSTRRKGLGIARKGKREGDWEERVRDPSLTLPISPPSRFLPPPFSLPFLRLPRRLTEYSSLSLSPLPPPPSFPRLPWRGSEPKLKMTQKNRQLRIRRVWNLFLTFLVVCLFFLILQSLSLCHQA